MKSAAQIRQEFIDFFRDRGHKFVPSSSLLPANDPTLLFTNAGMNQFKEIFLGREQPGYTRAANSQKCIRAGGKHNDLEDVGHDCYHHTFFEMLGNWSFGDYFKAEAIRWAWELLTDVWGLPRDRLYATYLGEDLGPEMEVDADSKRLWTEVTDIDPSHVAPGDPKDNFWEMGEVGPCGPCSEVHIDLTPDGSGANLVNAGHPQVMEIWNLVFIQYNRGEDGKLSPLPAQHVDTGMGLERIAAVLQRKNSNYATDLFTPIIEKLEEFTEHKYGRSSGLEDRFDVVGEDDMGDVACRVVADHARTLTFAIADGIIPSNEGRGYVIRRILRRAARYGRQYLNIDGPFMCELAPTVVEMMGDAFENLRDRAEYVTDTIRDEEESFGRTLDRGIERFDKEAGMVQMYWKFKKKGRKATPAEKVSGLPLNVSDDIAAEYDRAGENVLPGDVAFELYATYGFPIDLTQLMAAERGISVDTSGFEQAMAEHKKISASDRQFRAAEIPDLPATDDSPKYEPGEITAKVLGWVSDNQYISDGKLETNREAAVVLDRTNFYAEQGGQVGDSGELSWPGGRFEVSDTQPAGACVLHVGRVVEGELAAGAEVTCRVGPNRTDTMRNHTATHLLNWALREVLGDHVEQAGSVVEADRLRFDFSHNQALWDEQIRKVERLVNRRILADEPVTVRMLPLTEARKIPGVRAMFGEKYPDPVRVVTIGLGEDEQLGPDTAEGGWSVEFCGGTHLWRTAPIGLFKIVSQEAVARGVRRVEAVTGPAAVEKVAEMDRALGEISEVLKVPPEQAPQRIEAMQKQIKDLKKRPSGETAGGDVEIVSSKDTSAGAAVVARASAPEADGMRKFCDVQRQKGAAAVFVGAADDKKVTLIAMVSDDLASGGEVRADEWVRQAAEVVGGGGGGKPTLAQAGGKQPEKLPDALEAAGRWIDERLK